MALISQGTTRDRIHTQAGTGNRPSGTNGMVRVNSSNKCLEYHNGSGWQCATKPVDAGNGTINMNANGGLQASGSQGTANTSSDKLRTVSVNRAVTDTWYRGQNYQDSEVFCAIIYDSKTQTIAAGHDIRRVEKIGDGKRMITFMNPAANTNYIMGGNNSNAGIVMPWKTRTRTQVDVSSFGYDGGGADNSQINFMGVNIA